jgi:hypothetical protein
MGMFNVHLLRVRVEMTKQLSQYRVTDRTPPSTQHGEYTPALLEKQNMN